MTERLPVLVVGAGPVGLTTAAELARHGIPVRCVERATAPSPRSRALLVWPRTLEVFRGLSDSPSGALPVRAFRYYSDGNEVLRLRFSARTRPVVFPQPQVEAMLTARAEALGVRVERGTELVALAQSGDRVSAALASRAGPRTGAGSTADFAYVVGCDGASSTVRAQLGLGFEGATYPNTFVLADACLDGALGAESLHYFCSPRGVLVVIGLPSGRFRFFTSCPPGVADGDVTLELMQRLVDERGPGGLRLHDPDWVSTFLIHRRAVDRYRVGRAFLAGDAAHVHSPAGGQGLNTGVTDAHNLAWKIAYVHSGRSPASLLDSYGPERAGVAATVLRQSDLQTRAWLIRKPYQIRARDAALRVAGATSVPQRWYVPRLCGLRSHYPPAAPVHPGRPRPARGTRAAGRLLAGLLLAGRRHGVLPGALVPDVPVAASGGRPQRLRAALPATTFTLLLWTPAGRAVPRPLAALASWVAASHAAAVAVLVLNDAPGRRAFAVLVRPDHYVVGCATRRSVWQLRSSIEAVLAPPSPGQPVPAAAPRTLAVAR